MNTKTLFQVGTVSGDTKGPNAGSEAPGYPNA